MEHQISELEDEVNVESDRADKAESELESARETISERDDTISALREALEEVETIARRIL